MFEYIKTSLTYHYCFIEVPVSSEKSNWSCIYVLGVSFSYFISLILLLDFVTVPMMCYCFFVFFFFLFCYYRLEKTERAIKTGQSRNTCNIVQKTQNEEEKTQHGKLKR
jgi:hypothetical protein